MMIQASNEITHLAGDLMKRSIVPEGQNKLRMNADAESDSKSDQPRITAMRKSLINPTLVS